MDKVKANKSVVLIILGAVLATIGLCLLYRPGSISEANDIATTVGTIFALGSIMYAADDYTRSNAQKRAEYFVEMRVRFKSNKKFMTILAVLFNDPDSSWDKVEWQDRRDFLGFFEEVALMVNSGRMQLDVAAYMFGWYAIQCSECEKFWDKDRLLKTNKYWSLFDHFVKEVKKFADLDEFKPSKFQL